MPIALGVHDKGGEAAVGRQHWSAAGLDGRARQPATPHPSESSRRDPRLRRAGGRPISAAPVASACKDVPRGAISTALARSTRVSSKGTAQMPSFGPCRLNSSRPCGSYLTEMTSGSATIVVRRRSGSRADQFGSERRRFADARRHDEAVVGERRDAGELDFRLRVDGEIDRRACRLRRARCRRCPARRKRNRPVRPPREIERAPVAGIRQTCRTGPPPARIVLMAPPCREPNRASVRRPERQAGGDVEGGRDLAARTHPGRARTDGRPKSTRSVSHREQGPDRSTTRADRPGRSVATAGRCQV